LITCSVYVFCSDLRSSEGRVPEIAPMNLSQNHTTNGISMKKEGIQKTLCEFVNTWPLNAKQIRAVT
jgi:hypothetical protein